MKTIVLQPSLKAKQTPNFNKELYVDFMAVQIKFLSFLAYIIRIYQVCGCVCVCVVCVYMDSDVGYRSA